MHPKYEEDLYSWSQTNAALLRAGKFNEADMNHIIEELETLGRSNKRELVNRLGVLIAHLMKIKYQTEYLDKKSWIGTVERQRIDIADLLQENPSLKSYTIEGLPKSYKYALSILKEETPLEVNALPIECPYTIDQCLDEEFYPE